MPPSNKYCILPDAGTTTNYAVIHIQLLNKRPITNSLAVILLNSSLISAACTGILNISYLSTQSKLAWKIPHIQKSLLLLSAI